MSVSDDLAEKKRPASRLSLLGLFKEIFNWYPSEYPTAEKK